MQIEMDEKRQLDERKLRQKWLSSLKSSSKSEADWRTQSEKIIKKYRGENAKKNSFNVLYSNVDTLSPAIYNSKPKPDVRRRWSDEDHIGKAVAEVLRRALEFCVDTEEFESTIQLNLYDYLLSGRAVTRVRYVPQIQQMEEMVVESSLDEQQDSEFSEEIAWEQVVIEHVNYDDFRRGPGRSWDEVNWIAFKHNLDKEEIIERFGKEAADAIAFDEIDDAESNKKENKGAIPDGTTEVWEIWDKDKKRVLFIAQTYTDGILSSVDDPLQLVGFYPIPAPLYSFIDPTSLIPVPLYTLYEQQAAELDLVSMRINKIINAIKVRGIYDATISELSSLMTGDDNELIPAQNISMIMDRGGLDKAIWFMDIRPMAQILQQLYAQREQTKQVIYEIMGLSDILRGSTAASETATAQTIKSNWGSQRISRMQRAVQYYIRDIVRIMADIIGSKFQIETLQGMTGLKFPTQRDVIMLQMQGQQIPPDLVTWEQIKQTISSDITREYKVDIETDSTLAASQESDMQSLNQLLAGLSQLANGFAPMVQAGIMPVEAIKEIALAVIRRAKLGNAVEDSFEKIQQPQPQQQQPQPAQPQDNSLQIEQLRAQLRAQEIQSEQQLKTLEMQNQKDIEQGKAATQIHIAQLQLDAENMNKELDRQAKLREGLFS